MTKSPKRQTGSGKQVRLRADEKTRATARQAGRGKLKPMIVSMGFREFVLDQLGGLPELRPKPMFGGVGLYSGDAFFGIVAADSLYFKVDDSSRPAYERAGSAAFAPYVDRPQMRMATYYAVPAGILENAPELLKWARTSIAIARTSKKAKASKRTAR